ncbi:MAG: DUF815 domain-containing protein [Christensenellales bacterium]|jgi:hypothetical protein
MKETTASPAESARRITFLLNRLTVLRTLLRTEPAARLVELCDAVAESDATAAAARYHSMTAALLDQPTRRVTGDIFKDFLFSEILESSNRFSLMAAAGHADPPVMLAMEKDLRILQELFNLTCATLMDWIGSLNKAGQPAPTVQTRRTGSEDNISRMASSAWGGGFFPKDKQRARTPEPAVAAKLPDKLELSGWVRWEYSDPGERITYVADDGLAVIYRLFLAEEDWGRLVKPLYDFHRQHGSGEFLRYRIFADTDEGILGMELKDAPVWDEITVSNGQKERLYANTLRFLHTGKGEHALLYGPGGMGKSSLILALAKELPEIRLMFMARRDFAACMNTLRMLQEQPFRFIAFFDDLSLSEREYRRLKSAVKAQLHSGNALIYATSANPPPDSSVFGLEIGFDMLNPDDFERHVREEIRRSGTLVDYATIADACSRWREQRGELTLRSGTRLAEAIVRGQTANR